MNIECETKELANRLAEVKGATPITILAKTTPSMKMMANPFKSNVFKLARVNGLINWNYENSVNNQRAREEKEPDFESAPRQWGSLIKMFVEKDGHLYLQIKVQNVLSTSYMDRYGKTLSDKDLEILDKFLKIPPPSNTQDLDKEVICRDYALENILEAKFNNNVYIVQKPSVVTTDQLKFHLGL